MDLISAQVTKAKIRCYNKKLGKYYVRESAKKFKFPLQEEPYKSILQYYK